MLASILRYDKVEELFGHVKPIVSMLNDKLAVPVQVIQSKLSLRTEYLPETFNMPLNFTLGFLFMVCYLIVYTNNFIYNLLGMAYPILHSLYLFEEKPVATDKLLTMTKYWILFTLMTFADMIGASVLYFVPMYAYGRIILIYALIRNDFYLTNYIFDFVRQTYAELREIMICNHILRELS